MMKIHCIGLIALVFHASIYACYAIYEEESGHSHENLRNDERSLENMNQDPYNRHRISYNAGYMRSPHNTLYRPAMTYDSNSYIDYECDEKSQYYTPNHPKCMKPEDKCNSTSINFMPNHPDCADKCVETSINYSPNHPDCKEPEEPQCDDPCNAECENFDPEDPTCGPVVIPCDNPCNSTCSNFNPEDPLCDIDPEKPVCQAMLVGINTTLCEVNEEYQALTCGECPQVAMDIEDMTEACRSPSPDLIDCMAKVGTVEKNEQSCKMFEFKFKRSTMSPKCEKPKKDPTYGSKHTPIYKKPQYQQQIRTSYVSKKNRLPKNYSAPKKLFHQPRRMVTVLQRRYW